MTDWKLLLHGTIELCDGLELSLLSKYGDAFSAIVPLSSNEKSFEIWSCTPFVKERMPHYLILFA